MNGEKQEALRLRSKVLIFDLDGTLVDSLHDIAASVNHARSAFGLPQSTSDTIKTFVGDGIRLLIERSFDGRNFQHIEKAISFAKEYYQEHLIEKTTVYPGIVAILDYFKKKTKVVLTNKPENLAKQIIAGLGLSSYFVLVKGGSDGRQLKPHPEAVQTILAQFKVMPQDAVVVGDGVNDILVAKAAGVPSIAVTYGYTSKKDLLQLSPDFIIESPERLLAIID
jgi:phosphoglycolate phosphatase